MRQKEYPLRRSIAYQLPEFHVVFIFQVCKIVAVEFLVEGLKLGYVIRLSVIFNDPLSLKSIGCLRIAWPKRKNKHSSRLSLKVYFGFYVYRRNLSRVTLD